MTMQATAFALPPRPTASGTRPREGTVAADPAVLPAGTRIRITGSRGHDGFYLVTDTGAAVKGRRIDLYVPSVAEAKRFGRKTVRVEIHEMGQGKEDAREKDAALKRAR